MSTTIHLPRQLLETVDLRARELGMSRNRYIIRALERFVENETGWSPRFVEELAAARADDEAREALRRSRKASQSAEPPGRAGHRRQNRAALRLLHEWLSDASGYDEETWPQLEQALESNRSAGSRLLFHRSPRPLR